MLGEILPRSFLMVSFYCKISFLTRKIFCSFKSFCVGVNKQDMTADLNKNFRYIETLSDEEISKGILGHLTNLMQKKNNDPTYELPGLRQIKVTRWHSDPLYLVSKIVLLNDTKNVDNLNLVKLGIKSLVLGSANFYLLPQLPL
jgi:hypothetical protein